VKVCATWSRLDMTAIQTSLERKETQLDERSLLGILCSIHLSYGGVTEYQLVTVILFSLRVKLSL